MYAPTAKGAAAAGPDRTTPRMTVSSPNVATTSPSHSPEPVRVCVDHSTAGRSNMRLATTAPTQPPAIWAPM